ncbi:forespore capture DNA-binding protein RefZ [Sutcliffiella halmapala]|uniref:forespore capture DNA-binding protein RefZ n=1 Tax=Sutcliffiella halmapala TaxID=79882 RepID=UPI000994D3F9|nr:forespore capture DNA-binding protein RefZ [Sutcliffiella halmapala]
METTKQRIIDAAILLFNANGYSGTSIREIAKRAKVNVAHISYYFTNKAGLQEYLIATFLEEYLSVLEKIYQKLTTYSAKECAILSVKNVMAFHRENRQLARYVYREMTLDTMLVREVMSTYLMKEKYYLKSIFEKGKKNKEFQQISIPLVVMQLKSMIIMPFLQSQYLAEVWHVMPYETQTVDQYQKVIIEWLEHAVFSHHSVGKIAL